MQQKLGVGFTLLITFALFLSACTPGSAPAGQPAATPDAADQSTTAGATGQTQLRIAWWGSQDRHDRTIAVIEMFEEQHPEIDIVFEFSGWDDHWTKMTTQAAGNNLPDIMQQDYARLEEWVSRGLIAPLDPYVEDGTLNFDDIAESALAGGRIDGQLYGVNLGTNSMVIVVDLDLFEQAGVELPAADWTWNDFEQVALQLHDTLGVYAIGSGLSNEQMWKNVYLSLGEWVYNEDGTGLGYENDEPFIEYLNMVYRLQEAGAIPTREQEVADQGQSIEAQDIVTEEAAMALMWSNQLVAVWNAAGEDRNFGLLPLPRPEGGASANYLKPSMFFSITSQARQPAEAAQFIDFFINNVEANEILMAERGVPISSALRTALEPLLDEPQQATFTYLATIESTVSPIPPADVAGHADVINNVYWPLAIDPFLYGQQDVQQAVQTLREEANLVLEQSAQ